MPPPAEERLVSESERRTKEDRGSAPEVVASRTPAGTGALAKAELADAMGGPPALAEVLLVRPRVVGSARWEALASRLRPPAGAWGLAGV